MLLEIDHHSGVPIYRQVVDQISRQIMTSQLKETEQLDTVRQLAARLNVNPMTISKAYSSLEARGLVERKRGIGLFVANVTSENSHQIKTELIDDVIDKAAITAIQLGVSLAEAVELLIKTYQAYSSKTGGKNEK